MKKLVQAGSAILSLALVGSVVAQAPAPAASSPAAQQAPAQFGSIDQNKDGRVSQAEAQAYSELKAAFATLDADRDSYLSETEFQKWKSSDVSGGAPSDSAKDAAGNSAPQSAPAE